ncbi:MAG TPA: hypothetical protein VMG41_04070 [Gemmatimonadales bacterium]|nr:hypothetical protein [Gemmatimonadales bacterium]
MGLPALLLAQTLISLAPTVANTNTLAPAVGASPVLTAYELPSTIRSSLAAADLPDTNRRPRAVTLSNGYYTRLDIHRYAGYAVLPLFAIEYFAGQQLLDHGSAAPLWAEQIHKPAAYALAGIFTVNTVTGLLNLAEASQVSQGKKRRWYHSVLMLAAEGGMIYGVTVAPTLSKIDARIAAGTRGGWTPHKIATVASMSVATFSYLMMYIWKE